MKEVKTIIDKNLEAMIIPDGMVVINLDKKIIVFNEAASRITGYTIEETLNKNYDFLFNESSTDKLFIEKALYDNNFFNNLNLDITLKSGERLNVLASINPVVKENKTVSLIFVFRDTSEMITLSKKLEKKTSALIDERNKLDAIFNSRIEGTFTINKNWEITSFNLSAEKITGIKKEEAIGQKCWNVFQSSICKKGCHMQQTMQHGEATLGNELTIITKNGDTLPIRVNSSVLSDHKNETIGAVETFVDISELKNLKSHIENNFNFTGIIGKSKNLQRELSILQSVSQTRSTVLITGESGTGKELAARAIHLNSAEKTEPFLAINCSAFVESLIESELFGHEKGAFTGAIKEKKGRFELVGNGTIFLDEIGDLSLPVQTKLLRVLESREFQRVGGDKNLKLNARIIAATNKNLKLEIAARRFREDLYYRINVMNIHLPALKNRLDDLPLLINYFIKLFNEQFNKQITGISSSALEVLRGYNWPGNIRELENAIEHAFILCSSPQINTSHLPKRLVEKIEFTKELIEHNVLGNYKDFQKKQIISALKNNNGNRKNTAKELGMNPSTLWRKMKKFQLI